MTEPIRSHNMTPPITWEQLMRLGTAVARGRRKRAELDALFASGRAVQIEGVGHLRLVSSCLWWPVDTVVGWVETMLRPWRAKVFDGSSGSGFNWLAGWTRPIVFILTPRSRFRRSTHSSARGAIEGLPFVSSIGASQVNPEVEVLHVGYGAERTNPWLMRRATHDEVVQIGEGIYLGRVHSPLWSNRIVLYFALRQRV